MAVKVFLDLDGVLCSFVDAACALFGRDPAAVNCWNFFEPWGLSEDAFWGTIDTRGESFWADLPWTAQGQSILATVESHFGRENVCLLSSPSRAPHSAAGKVAWIGRHLPDYARRFLLGPAKHFAAGPGKLLVDDSDSNCREFRRAGGRAVLVPAAWNADRWPGGNLLPVLEERLAACRGGGGA